MILYEEEMQILMTVGLKFELLFSRKLVFLVPEIFNFYMFFIVTPRGKKYKSLI